MQRLEFAGGVPPFGSHGGKAVDLGLIDGALGGLAHRVLLTGLHSIALLIRGFVDPGGYLKAHYRVLRCRAILEAQSLRRLLREVGRSGLKVKGERHLVASKHAASKKPEDIA
ncbi:hypothetical protein RvVAR0630_07140 [Agrobacterium vitis]|nr:hypothetical protein RvVAR0630_07140 [Agrobacterium vitis]